MPALWIGGPPGAGKTSVATRLARRNGLRWYGADTRTWIHRDRALAAGNPSARRFEQLSPTERWSRPSHELLELSLHRERLQMVLDDVRALPARPLAIAEGTTVSPAALATDDVDRTRALWLIPTPAFADEQLKTRNLGDGQNRLYRLLAAVIQREAAEHDAPVLRVDGTLELDDVVDAVETRFAAALAAGPRAATRDERRALLREANAAIVAQVRGYWARPWADGDAETVVQEFLCECGDPTCSASVRLQVAAVAAEPALAPGHR
ncbi:MAG TPA: hypothetical protein VLK36_08435 [Gaiellaceae bacterium]|nr:hypothetical protein [Gaiellaceae bacterium]